MSKNSHQKQATKRKAAEKRAQRTADNLSKGKQCLRELVKQIDDIDIAQKTKPTAQSIRFMGITTELLARSTVNIHDIITSELPLDDFVMRTKTGNNYAFDIHWCPFESPISIKSIQNALYYEGKTFRGDYRYHFGDPLLATIYATCSQLKINVIVYLYYSKTTEYYEYAYFVTKGKNARELSEETLDRIANFVFYSTLLAQRLTTCHIKNIPITFNTTDEIEEVIEKIQQYDEEDRQYRPSTTQPGAKPYSPKQRDSNDCIAYIYYHADTNDITVSHRPHKGYKMRWWIVAEHQRRLKDGRTVTIQAYIKGDNTDEDAIRALEYYQKMQKKITCFKVVPST